MGSLSLTLLSLLLAYARAEETTMSTSIIQATRHETHAYTSSVPAASGGYSSYGSNAVNTEGGASGTSASSFNLSQGAMIAIIVVVVTVAVFGSKITPICLLPRYVQCANQYLSRFGRLVHPSQTPSMEHPPIDQTRLPPLNRQERTQRRRDAKEAIRHRRWLAI